MRSITVQHGRALFVLFAVAALALGGARPLAVAAVTALAAAVFVMGVLDRGIRRPAPRMDGISIALLVLTGLTFLQAVPLPPWLVETISPRASDIHDGAWAALGVAHRGGWRPLSLDPPATVAAGLAMLAVTLTYLTVRYRLRAHGGRGILEAVVAAGSAVAIVFLLHRLAGWTKVYDEYAPRYVAGDWIPAPFVNANHLAGALGMTAVLAFGLAMSSPDRFRRLTMISAGAVTGGACLLTLSRGGIIAFVAAVAMFVALRAAGGKNRGGTAGAADSDAVEAGREAERPRRSSSTTNLPGRRAGGRELGWALLGLLLALSAGSYVAYDAIVREFAAGDASKLDLPREAIPMAADHPWTGVGRGAYAAAYPAYQKQPDTVTYTHPENLPAQFAAEWGLVFGGAALLGLLFVLGRAVVRPPAESHNCGAVAAAFGLLLQNQVDFGLELLGLALPFVAVLAVVREVGAVGDRERVRRPSGGRFRPPGRTAFVGPVAAAVLLAFAYPWAAEHGIEVETDRFRLYASSKTFHPGILDDARGAFARHPADYFLPYLAGVHLARMGKHEPLRFWNQSLRLRPGFAPTHFAVASYLAAIPGARSQAVEEFGEAVRIRPGLLPAAAAAVARIAAGPEEAEPFLRTCGANRAAALDALATSWETSGAAAAAAEADAAILRLDAGDAPARIRRARRALDAGDAGGSLAEIHSAGSGKLRRPAACLIAASALVRSGRDAAAVALLEPCATFFGSPDVTLALAEEYARGGDVDRAVRTLASLEAGARTQRDRTDAVVRRAGFLARWGRAADALVEIRRAVGIDPGRIDLWRTAADLAERIGDTPGAIHALRELARRLPGDAAVHDRLDRLETRSLQRRMLGTELPDR
ncbi:MAG: O-antigen ligase family protein [Myxococcota bacterium]|nr:O-antigen ligase family protein [Myxococcota bacterium]